MKSHTNQLLSTHAQNFIYRISNIPIQLQHQCLHTQRDRIACVHRTKKKRREKEEEECEETEFLSVSSPLLMCRRVTGTPNKCVVRR